MMALTAVVVVGLSALCLQAAMLSMPGGWLRPPCVECSVALLQVKEVNMEEGGAFTVSSAEEILAGLSKSK